MFRKYIGMLLLSLLSALALAASPAGAAPTATSPSPRADVYDCPDFKRHGDTAWYKAQQQYVDDLRRYRKDVNGLDGDSDGYACESLPAVTKSPGEPECFDDRYGPYPLNCSVRNLYRQVTMLTTYGDARALRGATVAVWGPMTRKHSWLVQPYQEAFDSAGYSPDCQREVMQRFLHIQADNEKSMKYLTSGFSLGDKAANAWLKKYGKSTKAARGAVGLYLDYAGKAATAATNTAIAGAAKNMMMEQATC